MSKPTTHPCFVAMTRPPMRCGTTISFLFVNAMGHLLLYVVLSRRFGISFFFFLGSSCLFQLLGMLACQYDVRWFDLWMGKRSFSCLNKKLWGCDSYEPY